MNSIHHSPAAKCLFTKLKNIFLSFRIFIRSLSIDIKQPFQVLSKYLVSLSGPHVTEKDPLDQSLLTFSPIAHISALVNIYRDGSTVWFVLSLHISSEALAIVLKNNMEMLFLFMCLIIYIGSKIQIFL